MIKIENMRNGTRRKAMTRTMQMILASCAMAMMVAMPSAACKTPLPGADGKHPAVTYAPFPDALSAFVWRNWPVVPAERLADAIGASGFNIWTLGIYNKWYNKSRYRIYNFINKSKIIQLSC